MVWALRGLLPVRVRSQPVSALNVKPSRAGVCAFCERNGYGHAGGCPQSGRGGADASTVLRDSAGLRQTLREQVPRVFERGGFTRSTVAVVWPNAR